VFLGAAEHYHNLDLCWCPTEKVEDDVSKPLRNHVALVGLVILIFCAIEMQRRCFEFRVCHNKRRPPLSIF
ncbi:MAG: hypothetical protein II343_05390, partial [Clostridia bacterium]|nr:hypothetical protein [Clostridia bacterium]